MNLSEKFNWNLVSRFRSEIMGVAIILVLICHTDSFFNWNMATDIFRVFAVGVDIFLFVSGIGLYFSMKKNGDVLYFYKKRFLRIVPEFLIISVISYAILDFISSETIQPFWGDLPQFLLKISGIRAAFICESGENGMLWYVIFIILMYLFYPVLFSFEKLNDKTRKILFSFVIVFPIIAELFIAVFIPEILKKYEIDRMITRIPIFALGAYMV